MDSVVTAATPHWSIVTALIIMTVCSVISCGLNISNWLSLRDMRSFSRIVKELTETLRAMKEESKTEHRLLEMRLDNMEKRG